MFAANDHQHSNMYLTPKNQLVVIEQGGADAFFTIPKKDAPESLEGGRYKERDIRSESWRFIGVIRDGKFFRSDESEECIALLGEGRSPYRKQYQVPNFCST